MSTDSIRAVVRLRTLGPSGLNPPQIEVVDRLQTLTDNEESPVAELDVDVWGASMGITQAPNQNQDETRETVAEFIQWANTNGYSLQPAFEWRSPDPEDIRESQSEQIVTPLITLAAYNEAGESLQAVYPHVDGDDVYTVHDGIEALESMGEPRDSTSSDNEQSDHEDPAVLFHFR